MRSAPRFHDVIVPSSVVPMIESSDDAIIGTTLDGTITSWNRGAERIYGHNSEELIGRHITALAPMGCQDQIATFLDTLRRGERVEQIEILRLHKDGSLRDISVTISPIHDSEARIVGTSLIGRDVTQLREAQRDISERQGRIRLLLESTAEGIVGLG